MNRYFRNADNKFVSSVAFYVVSGVLSSDADSSVALTDEEINLIMGDPGMCVIYLSDGSTAPILFANTTGVAYASAVTSANSAYTLTVNFATFEA